MTRHTGQSAENHGTDSGLQRLKGAAQLALDDEARSAWLDAAIRTPAKAVARNTGRVHGRLGGRRTAAIPKPRTGWTCPECGARNRLFVVCIECRAVKGT
ncbi:MAG: hypothetical protein WCK73_14545 [Deltaproteobacteria bacterium]